MVVHVTEREVEEAGMAMLKVMPPPVCLRERAGIMEVVLVHLARQHAARKMVETTVMAVVSLVCVAKKLQHSLLAW